MLSGAARAAQPGATVGRAVLFGVDWLVEGKFYSVFCLLFGIGFGPQARRASAGDERSFRRLYRRRMVVLILIGPGHMYALWAGDILTLYGVTGMAGRIPPATSVCCATFATSPGRIGSAGS
jgi:uncharacterized protein